MKRVPALVAVVLAVPSAIALWSAASSAGEAIRPVAPETEALRRGHSVAGREALGRRVLVLLADPGKPRTSSILESGRAPEGWALYAATPPDAGDFGTWTQSLAAAAGASWDRDRGVAPDVARALSLFAVKAVLADDAGKGAKLLTVLDVAEPVLRLDGGDGAEAKDPVSLAALLQTSPARESNGWTWSDWDDTLWGGAVTVETKRAGRFLFPYPAAGGRVTVNDAPAIRASAGPLLAIDLPAGTSRVDVRFLEGGSGQTLAIAGAAGLAAALLALLIALRPSHAEVVAAADAAEDRARV